MSALVALVAAAVFGIAVAVQQHEAARAEVKATLRPGLLMRLARRPMRLFDTREAALDWLTKDEPLTGPHADIIGVTPAAR